MNPTVLVIDDEAPIRNMLAYSLGSADMDVLTAPGGKAALRMLGESRPDLILIDWMMPDIDGLQLTRKLRRDPALHDIPIILLTARSSEDDRTRGLDAGADDYVVKPFSTRELIARVRAILRRVSPVDESGRINVKGLVMDTIQHRVLADAKPLSLGPTEFKLLRFFMTHTGRAWSRSQLLDHVWGQNSPVEERTVDVHIRRLRKALEPAGYHRFVQTVRGHGYRFSDVV